MRRGEVGAWRGVAAAGLLLASCGGSGDLDVRPRPAGTTPEAPLATISRGERVDLAEHLAPQGRTIFEFTAAW